jgi:heme-degrading monooxygenase HmoA
MYLRANMFSMEPGRIDDLVRHMTDTVLPIVQEQQGNRGLAMAVDRQAGKCSIVSFWEDRELMRATEPRISKLREDIRENYGGSAIEVTEAEVLGVHIRTQPKAGCWNRVSMLDLAPNDVGAAVETFNASTLPALDALDGFCAAILCADRERGRAVAVTTWRDRDALKASDERANALREEVRDKTHGQIAAVMEMEIVISEVRPDQ